MYKAFAAAVKVPILANITEFGATPLFTLDELRSADVAIALYPLSAFRAMNKAALDVYRDAAPRRHAEGRRRHDADARGALRLPRLPRVRSTSSTRCSPRARTNLIRENVDDRRTPPRPKPKKSVAPVRRHRRQHGALHGRPHRQRPRLSRLRHPRHRRDAASSRRSPTCWSTASCRRAPSSRPTRRKLKSLRGLPAPVKEILERIPAAAHPMDVMRTAVSALGTVLPEKDDHGAPGARDIADRLIASLGSMLLYWYHWSHNGKRIDVETDDDSIGGHFLHLLHGRAPKPSWVRAMHTSLNLYAEHEFNASTFTARVIAGTGSDIYSGITGAIGALRGPKHGGANEFVVRDRRSATTRPTRPRRTSAGASPSKEVIIGFGHPVYTIADPRNKVIKEVAPQPVAGRRQHQDVRHRRAHRDGDVGREEDVRESRLVLRGLLSHDGRADGDVHAALRDLAHRRLVGARHRAAHRRQDHPPSANYIGPTTRSSSRSTSETRSEPPSLMSATISNVRPKPDQVLVDIADYVTKYKITSKEALDTARHCLIDTLGCGLEALSYPACTKLLGPIVPGTIVPNGAQGARHVVPARSGAGRVQHRRDDPLARLQRHLARRRMGSSRRTISAASSRPPTGCRATRSPPGKRAARR